MPIDRPAPSAPETQLPETPISKEAPSEEPIEAPASNDAESSGVSSKPSNSFTYNPSPAIDEVQPSPNQELGDLVEDPPLRQAAQALIDPTASKPDNLFGEVVIWLTVFGSLSLAAGLMLARRRLPAGLLS